MKPHHLFHLSGLVALALAGSPGSGASAGGADGAEALDLWTLARQHADVHRYSTLFTAQDVRDRLSSEEGLRQAVDWCRRTGVTKVYVEAFRDGYQAERAALERARDHFRAAGFEVSGCVTTTGVGKKSTGWSVICCYTDPPTQEHIRRIFEFTASLFDEIMIDDFWFTDCRCEACDRARRAREVRIGDRTWPVPDDSWNAYHAELMLRMSEVYVLGAAKRVNPRCRLIIKYPQWYDRFHERGYDVVRETAAFDRIWVGTETRDYTDKRWGGTVQYEAYFIMRWLGGIGGEKCGGGWFDWLGTTEATYLEQARQTILAGARESMLFCYGGLQRDTGPANVAALRRELPELLRVAAEVRRRKVLGIAAYKPPNSAPDPEAYVFDFAGMLGLPLAPCHEFPTDAPAAFFPVHALEDPQFAPRLEKFIASGRPVLLTDGLVKRLRGRVALDRPNVHVLAVRGQPKNLLELGRADLAALRGPLLKPLGVTFDAPNKVALYWFEDRSWVVENFNDEPVTVRLNGVEMEVPARGWRHAWTRR